MTLSVLQLCTTRRNLFQSLSLFAFVSPLCSIHGSLYPIYNFVSFVANLKPRSKNCSTKILQTSHESVPLIPSQNHKNKKTQQFTQYDSSSDTSRIRLSKFLATHGHNSQLSRRAAEYAIINGFVTIAGQKILNPCQLINLNQVGTIKVNGKLLVSNPCSTTKVWLVHKLKGEIVTEHDPLGRNSMMERLKCGGLGCSKNTRTHLKPIGRLDFNTEGLMIITNDGAYANQMEQPKNHIHRSYRVRVHGTLTDEKLIAIQKGMVIQGIKYKGMKVVLEVNSRNRTKNKERTNKIKRKKSSSTIIRKKANHWLRITCVEGKNRQIRKMLSELKLNISRLIRISFGDYNLNKIPPGMVIEVPIKTIDKHKQKGYLVPCQIRIIGSRENSNKRMVLQREPVSPIQWIN